MQAQWAILHEVRRYFRGLRDVLMDDYARRTLLEQLGWKTDTPAPPLTSWEALDRMDAMRGETDPDAEALRGLVDDVLILAGVIHDFAVAAKSDDTPAEAVGDALLALISVSSLRYLHKRVPWIYGLGRFLGFIDDRFSAYSLEQYNRSSFVKFLRSPRDWFSEWQQAHPTIEGDPSSPEGNWSKFIGDLAGILGGIIFAARFGDWRWGWDPTPGSTTPVADALSRRALTIWFKWTARPVGSTEELVDVILPITLLYMPEAHHGPALFVSVGPGLEREFDAGPIRFTIRLSSPDGFDLAIPLTTDPDRAAEILQGLLPHDGHLRITAEWARPEGDLVYLGNPRGTHFEFHTFYVDVEGIVDGTTGETNARVAVKLVIREGALVLSGRDSDGILGTLFGWPKNGEVRLTIDGGIEWSTDDGFHLIGAVGLELLIPLGWTLFGSFTVQFVKLSLQAAETEAQTSLVFEVTIAATLNTKGFKVTADQFGYRWNLLALDDSKFTPPRGIGIVLDLGPVTGGGYLMIDDERGLYTGAVQLDLWGVALSGYGIFQKLGEDDWSFVIFLGLEFRPIPLFFGITLNGIGGIWGDDRTVDKDVLLDGIRTGVLDDLLFPKDVVANAPRIVQTVTRVFPIAKGQTILGVMVKLGFGVPNVATASIGILHEGPSPERWVLLANFRLFLPAEEAPLVRIEFDGVGVWDLTNDETELFGSLHASKIACFTLTGDATYHSIGGDEPFFGWSIGGFHPSYDPPIPFRPMKRLALDFTGMSNPRLRASAYLARTSNSWQGGGRIELVFRKAGFSLEGILSFDAIVHDDYYEFDLSITIALKRGSTTICGIHFEGKKTGPSPVRIVGKASISFFFFSISFPVDHTSAGPRSSGLSQSNPSQLLLGALREPRNWQPELRRSDSMVVSVKPPIDPTVVRVHPAGELAVRQHVVPLGIEIAKFGPTRPVGPRRFDLGGFEVNGETVNARAIDDKFAPGQFFALSDDEMLSRPAFENMQAGVSLGSDDVEVGEILDAEMEYETIVVDSLERRNARSLGVHVLSTTLLAAAIETGAVARSPIRDRGAARYHVVRSGVKVSSAAYALVDAGTLAPVTTLRTTYTAARQELDAIVASDPAHRGRLRIVGSHEGMWR